MTSEKLTRLREKQKTIAAQIQRKENRLKNKNAKKTRGEKSSLVRRCFIKLTMTANTKPGS